ncbi:MAG TPA: amino acid adenylation domain-containing protein [Xanthobacteraceae bacterium]|jgi:amino acid adenylation domain-containing protein|nr:amino acid adenylation domain-containing protein [Xanthobacteraceae bacterium]
MISRDNIKDIYPLTAFQEGIAFHDLLEREAGGDGQRSYFQQMRFSIRGPLDVAAFDRAFAVVVARHDMLRTVFRLTGGDRALQIVLKARPFACDIVDLSALPPQDRAARVEAYAKAQRETPFDLQRDVLLRVGVLVETRDTARVVFSFHHILMDGWCIGILQDELTRAYQAYARGAEPELPRPVPFSAFVKASLARRERAGLGYWRDYLAGADTALPLPAARARALGTGRDMRTHTAGFSADLTRRLTARAQASGATFNSLIQALWGLLLAKVEDRADVVFGAMASTRPPDMEGADAILGPCIGMLPLRVRLKAGESVSAFLRRAQAERMDWLENVHCALADIQAASPLRQGLIGHYFVFENYPLEDRFQGAAQELAPGVTIEDVSVYQTSNYDFGVVALPGAELKIALSFNADVVDPDRVARLAAWLEVLAQQVADAPQRAVEDLTLLDAAEHRQVMAWGDGGALPAPAETLRAARAALVAREGAAPALRIGDRIISHAALERQARHLALRLAGLGAIASTPVALHADAGEGLATAMLACLLLGVPYVPLDLPSPPARLAHILADCDARLVLSTAPERLPNLPDGVALLSLEEELARARGAEGAVACTALPPLPADPTAYVIYTSGTTGQPKGVRIGHGALLAYVSWLVQRCGPQFPLRTALLTSPAFDLGYTAVFGALLGGGCLSLLDEEARRDPEQVLALLAAHRLTLLKLTPSYLAMLMATPGGAEAFVGARDLRLILLGGEAQNFADLQQLQRLAPHVSLANHYGPTETTIGCVSGPLDDLARAGEGPQRIGQPIAGARAFVCDHSLRPVPEGVAGELLVGGAGLAQGYVNASPADAARFTRLSLAGEPASGDLPVYRTGDKVRWLPGGQLEFLGRMDDQVKIRGYRVSLKEVEAGLRALPLVADAAAVVDARSGTAELFAYVILAEGAGGDAGALRAALATRLPPAMVPSRFFPVSRFPMTANGKLDRKALEDHWRAPTAEARADAPGSALEEGLRKLWKEVLFLDSVGLEEDFFALGGHSLKAIALVSKAKAALGRQLTLRSLFDHPTIRALAAHLERPLADAAPPPLLKLRAGSPGAPVAFFFPPALGTSTLYRDLTEPLDCDVACYGLQAPGFDADMPFAPSLAAAAALFAAQIVPVESAYPLRLVGWSLGAHFALETARLLEARGRAVTLVLLDAAPGERAPEKGATPPAAFTFVQLRTKPYWGRVLAIMEQLPPQDFARIERLAAHNQAIARAHRPGAPLAAPILCIEAADAVPRAGGAAFRAATRGPFVLQEVGGDHYSMFHPPHVHTVLALLRQVLSASDASASAASGKVASAASAAPSLTV